VVITVASRDIWSLAQRCFIENEKFLQNAVVRVSPISISCVLSTFIKQSQNLVL